MDAGGTQKKKTYLHAMPPIEKKIYNQVEEKLLKMPPQIQCQKQNL